MACAKWGPPPRQVEALRRELEEARLAKEGAAPPAGPGPGEGEGPGAAVALSASADVGALLEAERRAMRARLEEEMAGRLKEYEALYRSAEVRRHQQRPPP